MGNTYMYKTKKCLEILYFKFKNNKIAAYIYSDYGVIYIYISEEIWLRAQFNVKKSKRL